MPRFPNIRDTLLEFNKMSSQVGTRYRESGLVLRHTADVEIFCIELPGTANNDHLVSESDNISGCRNHISGEVKLNFIKNWNGGSYGNFHHAR